MKLLTSKWKPIDTEKERKDLNTMKVYMQSGIEVIWAKMQVFQSFFVYFVFSL